MSTVFIVNRAFLQLAWANSMVTSSSKGAVFKGHGECYTATVDGSEIWQTHQLRLVVYPIIYLQTGFLTSQLVVWDFWTINSISIDLLEFLFRTIGRPFPKRPQNDHPVVTWNYLTIAIELNVLLSWIVLQLLRVHVGVFVDSGSFSFELPESLLPLACIWDGASGYQLLAAWCCEWCLHHCTLSQPFAATHPVQDCWSGCGWDSSSATEGQRAETCKVSRLRFVCTSWQLAFSANHCFHFFSFG